MTNVYINTQTFHTQPPTIWLHKDTLTLTPTHCDTYKHMRNENKHTHNTASPTPIPHTNSWRKGSLSS